MNPNRKPKRKRINPYDSEALGSGFANAVHKAERNATPDQRLAAIEAVLELHSEDEGTCRECSRIATEPIEGEYGPQTVEYPCPTVWAIREALE
jgi:hypothetical protein